MLAEVAKVHGRCVEPCAAPKTGRCATAIRMLAVTLRWGIDWIGSSMRRTVVTVRAEAWWLTFGG